MLKTYYQQLHNLEVEKEKLEKILAETNLTISRKILQEWPRENYPKTIDTDIYWFFQNNENLEKLLILAGEYNSNTNTIQFKRSHLNPLWQVISPNGNKAHFQEYMGMGDTQDGITITMSLKDNSEPIITYLPDKRTPIKSYQEETLEEILSTIRLLQELHDNNIKTILVLPNGIYSNPEEYPNITQVFQEYWEGNN